MAALRVEDVPVATSALVARARPDSEAAAVDSPPPSVRDVVRSLAREVDQALETMRVASGRRAPRTDAFPAAASRHVDRDLGSHAAVEVLVSIARLCDRIVRLLDAEHTVENDGIDAERAFDIIEVFADESVDRYRLAIHPWMAGARGSLIDDDGARLVALHHDQLVEALGGLPGLSAERTTRLLSVSWALSVIAMQVAVLAFTLDDLELS